MTTPVLSFSSFDRYCKCPGGYYLSYIDPERKTKQVTSDATGTLPGRVVHKLFEASGKKDPETKQFVGFDRAAFLDRRRLYAILSSELEDPRIRLHPEHQDEWARSKDAAMAAIAEWRGNLLHILESDGFIKPFMLNEFKFGSYNSPLVLNDQVKIAGAIDLFSADSREAPGRLVDFKASYVTDRLNVDQLKLYDLAMRAHGFRVGMCGFVLFRIRRRPEYHAFNKTDRADFVERLADASKKIQLKVFPFTPSKASCRYCDHRDKCSVAVKEDASKDRPAKQPQGSKTGWDIPDL